MYMHLLCDLQLSKMCLRMDELWSDGIGSVILYTWLQFITSEALHLAGAGPDSHYLLKIEDPNTSSPDWDPRAIQGILFTNNVH